MRTGLEAGVRPSASDGLATFGGVRALARYVKIEAVPASGGTIVINEVSRKSFGSASTTRLFFGWGVSCLAHFCTKIDFSDQQRCTLVDSSSAPLGILDQTAHQTRDGVDSEGLFPTTNDVSVMCLRTQVDVRVGEDAPIRPLAEKAWLKETGSLPLGSDPSSSLDPNYDERAASAGGCDAPGHMEGCQVFYIKVFVPLMR